MALEQGKSQLSILSVGGYDFSSGITPENYLSYSGVDKFTGYIDWSKIPGTQVRLGFYATVRVVSGSPTINVKISGKIPTEFASYSGGVTGDFNAHSMILSGTGASYVQTGSVGSFITKPTGSTCLACTVLGDPASFYVLTPLVTIESELGFQGILLWGNSATSVPHVTTYDESNHYSWPVDFSAFESDQIMATLCGTMEGYPSPENVYRLRIGGNPSTADGDVIVSLTKTSSTPSVAETRVSSSIFFKPTGSLLPVKVTGYGRAFAAGGYNTKIYNCTVLFTNA